MSGSEPDDVAKDVDEGIASYIVKLAFWSSLYECTFGLWEVIRPQRDTKEGQTYGVVGLLLAFDMDSLDPVGTIMYLREGSSI